MNQILDKLCKLSYKKSVQAILDVYNNQGFCTINFIYFANIVANQLFEDNNKLNKIYKELYPERKKLLLGKLENSKLIDYKNILLKSDFLMPDGIALQVFYLVARKRWLTNLNGSDFLPFFLEEVKFKYGNHKICLMLYGSYQKIVEDTKKHLSFKGYNVVYIQNGYEEFNWEHAAEELSHYTDTINILLVARTTPEVPIQELRLKDNIHEIEKNKLIVLTVGGGFDHMIGIQKRPPKPVRWLKLEWLWRLIAQPKRNAKKVYYSLSCFRYVFSYLLLKKK